MLSKLILSLLIAFALAQTPIPVPLNMTAMNGLWYGTWLYADGANLTNMVMPDCVYLKIVNATNQGGIFNFTVKEGHGEPSDNSDLPFTVNGTNTGSWVIQDVNWEWVSFDMYASTWGLMASADNGFAWLFSRYLTETQLVIDAAAGVLALEGFPINSVNNIAFTNPNCTWAEPVMA